MTTIFHSAARIAARVTTLSLLGALCGPAHGQEPSTPPAVAKAQRQAIAHGDPARWYREDASPGAQLRALHKEINAAYKEATRACKSMHGDERDACVKQALSTYQQDMVQAKQIRDENNRLQ